MPLKSSIRIELYNGIVRFSATACLSCIVYVSDRSNAEKTRTLFFTAVTQNQHSRKSRHTTKITAKATVTVSTRLPYSAKKCYTTNWSRLYIH